jgi:hypothetical protein
MYPADDHPPGYVPGRKRVGFASEGLPFDVARDRHSDARQSPAPETPGGSGLNATYASARQTEHGWASEPASAGRVVSVSGPTVIQRPALAPAADARRVAAGFAPRRASRSGRGRAHDLPRPWCPVVRGVARLGRPTTGSGRASCGLREATPCLDSLGRVRPAIPGRP